MRSKILILIFYLLIIPVVVLVGITMVVFSDMSPDPEPQMVYETFTETPTPIPTPTPTPSPSQMTLQRYYGQYPYPAQEAPIITFTPTPNNAINNDMKNPKTFIPYPTTTPYPIHTQSIQQLPGFTMPTTSKYDGPPGCNWSCQAKIDENYKKCDSECQARLRNYTRIIITTQTRYYPKNF